MEALHLSGLFKVAADLVPVHAWESHQELYVGHFLEGAARASSVRARSRPSRGVTQHPSLGNRGMHHGPFDPDPVFEMPAADGHNLQSIRVVALPRSQIRLKRLASAAGRLGEDQNQR